MRRPTFLSASIFCSFFVHFFLFMSSITLNSIGREMSKKSKSRTTEFRKSKHRKAKFGMSGHMNSKSGFTYLRWSFKPRLPELDLLRLDLPGLGHPSFGLPNHGLRIFGLPKLGHPGLGLTGLCLP